MSSKRAEQLGRYKNITGWMFVSPALVLMGIFMIYPILWSLWMSFQTGKGVRTKFGGFDNMVRLANDPIFVKALGNTMIFLAIQVPIMIFLAIIMASLLNKSNLWARGWFRTAIFLPCVTSLVAYSILFKSMFSIDGVVNQTLMFIGIVDDPIGWLTDPFWAKTLIIIAITWRWTGYNMIFYLSAMQNIDPSIYEAARIDGISAWRRLISLTIPMMKPVILFTTVTSTIGTLQLFDEVNNLTLGGPSDSTLTLSLYIFNLTFKFMPSYGYAATVSYVIVFIVVILAYLQFRVSRERK